jgi:hypothetical protein
MNNGATPPTGRVMPPELSDHPTAFYGQGDLSEGPWTTLVMSLLAGVAVMLYAAGAYAGGL